MKKVFSGGAMIVAALSGCGGGDSAPPTRDASRAQATAPDHLLPYVGTWTGDCMGNEKVTMTFTHTAPDTLQASTRIDLYANVDCSGRIEGTIVPTATAPGGALATIKYVGTSSVTATLAPDTAPSTFQADNATVSTPAGSATLTGPGVVTTTGPDGKQRSCVNFNNGASECEDGSVEPAGTDTLQLYARGNNLYLLGITTMSDVSGQSQNLPTHFRFTRQ